MEARLSVERHVGRLRTLWLVLAASLALYAVIVAVLPPITAPFAQGRHFLWLFAAVAVLNLVSIMPVYRAMLAGPRRVYGVSQQLEPLLAAHSHAHTIAMARVEAIAVLGLVLYFLAGVRDWFWAFEAVAVGGLVLLWPLREKVMALAVGATRIVAQPVP